MFEIGNFGMLAMGPLTLSLNVGLAVSIHGMISADFVRLYDIERRNGAVALFR